MNQAFAASTSKCAYCIAIVREQLHQAVKVQKDVITKPIYILADGHH